MVRTILESLKLLNVVNMISFLVFLKIIFILPLIFAATHWVVTQDGRIAPQMDSVFQLEKPHDLMALLAQEDRIAKADLLREELFKKKSEFEQRDDKDSGPLIEEKLYSTDPDCLKVGRKVTAMTIFESTFSSMEFYGVDIARELSWPQGEFRHLPECNLQLDFSMQAFEHLTGVHQRTTLVMEPETVLEELIPQGMDLNQFGHWIAFNLDKNTTSWIAYNLATLYFRIIGNAFKALQCCRLALHFSPRHYKTIALVSMGNILTHSHHQEDGIIVLHAAVDHTPSDPMAHYTLANSYAMIGDLNRSLLCYENVIKLQPDNKMAVKKMHGIQCLSKLERALEAQHSVLQNTLTELKDQQKKFEEWNQLQEKIVEAQAPVSQRLRSQLEYQEFRMQTAKRPPLHDCEQYEEDGFMFFQCNIKTDMSTLETWGSAMMDLRNRLVDFQTQTDKIVDLLSLRNVAANQSTLTGEFNESAPRMEHSKSSHLRAASLTESRPIVDTGESQFSIRPLTDSELQRCPNLVFKTDQIPSVFLSLESQGFDIRDLLNGKIGLRVDEDHPLPWYPPVCDKLNLKLLPYDEMAPIKTRNDIRILLRDTSIQRHLLNYVKSNVGDMFDKETDDIQTTTALAQVGQRILTALRNGVGPPWLLNTLAALYWRGHGKASNGIDCFRQALSTVPDQYAHIPLTNLAALLLKTGHIQDALTLTLMAYKIRRDDPTINYLLGILHLVSGNYTDSLRHLQQTLDIQPDFVGAEHSRLIAACLVAEKEASQNLQCKGDLASDATYRTVLRCSKADEEEETNGSSHCEAEVQGLTLTPSSQEVAAIADTEDGLEIDMEVSEKKFNSMELVQDDYLPEGLLRIGMLTQLSPMTPQQCQAYRTRSRSQFTSTWLSVAAKNIDFKSLIPKSVPASETGEPVCDGTFPVSMATMDHLTGVRHRDKIDYKAESALEEALNTLMFDSKENVDPSDAARYLNHALKNNGTSWILATAASLYWRVKGNAKNAIDCLRIALHHVPHHYKDIPLISLSNILHRARLYNDALVSAYMALEISPTFVVIHFTLANIHASRGDVMRALSFYQSTLSLQPSFEPARQRYCEISLS